MHYERALISAANGKAILFTGAGFSLGATAIDGNSFPTGPELIKILCQSANLPDTPDLKTASSWFLKRKSAGDLIELLKGKFSAKEVREKHETIASIPWKSIYTTNYDDILELASKKGSKKLTPVTLADAPSDHGKSGNTVVHINGFIDRLTESNLLAEFKLTNTSYLTSQFRESDWCSLFLHQVRSAQAIFFVGYSLYDIDLQELLYADKNLREKTFFIQRPDMDIEELTLSGINDFGTIMPIGVEQFAIDLKNIDPLAISTDNSLVLVELEEMKLPSTIPTTTSEDIFSLLLRGEVNSDLISAQIINSNNSKYIFKRDGTNLIRSDFQNYVIIGDLGNGKTTLLRCISAELLKQGTRCFWVKDESYNCEEEIDSILNLPDQIVIVIDNYTRKLELIEYINIKRKNNTIVLLAARTLLHKSNQEELYYKRIRIDLSKTCEIDCNKLSTGELNNLSAYFSEYGLWGQRTSDTSKNKLTYLNKTCSSELHGVLLDLLSSPEIQTRFSTLFATFEGSKESTKALIAGFALNLLNITNPTAQMIAATTGDSTIFSQAFKGNPILRQFFNHSHDVITPKSVALAEFCMKTFPDPNLLVDCLIDICRATRKKAASDKKAKTSRFYWDIYRDLASFSNIKRILPKNGKRELLIRFYEGLRTIDLERDNPLFWLQYAMARMNEPQPDDLTQAATYLNTALSIAKTKPNFTTTDIETQQARLYMEHAIHTSKNSHEAYNYFIEANNRLLRIIKTELYKSEPYRPMHNYSRWYSKFSQGFTMQQKASIHDSLDTIIKNSTRLPPKVAEEQVIITAIKIIREVIFKIETSMKD